MRLIVEIDLNPGEGHTLTVRKLKAVPRRLEALVAQDRDLLNALVKEALEQVLQSEMTEILGAGPGERVEGRGGFSRNIKLPKPLNFTKSPPSNAAAISSKKRLTISFASRLSSPSCSKSVIASMAFVTVIEK